MSDKRKKKNQRKGLSPVLLGVVIVVVVAAIAVIALVARGGSDSGSSSDSAKQETASVTVTGTPLPDLPASSSTPDPALGLTPPTVSGQSFDGSAVTITPGKSGNYTMVSIGAHWCPHCQKEFPVIASWLKADKPKNLDVYAISTGIRPDAMVPAANWPPSAWFEKLGWTAPVLLDAGPDQAAKGETASAAALAYGVTGFPTVVVLDPAGKVVARHSGEFTDIPFEDWIANAMKNP